MNLRIFAGNSAKILFSFYDESGNLLNNLSSVTADLYSSLDNSIIDSNLSLSLSSDNNNYELIYTPDNNLNGTYYFRAKGIDPDGILRFSTVFVDIIPLSSSISIITPDLASKYINDFNIDYSILPILIETATDWVRDLVGGSIFPESIVEYVKVFDKKIYLSKFPILSINYVKDKDGNILDYYILEQDTGILKLGDNVKDTIDEVVVSYVAGYNPIPSSIYTAIAMIVGYLYDKMKYQSFDRIKLSSLTAVISDNVLEKIKEILQPYIKYV